MQGFVLILFSYLVQRGVERNQQTRGPLEVEPGAADFRTVIAKPSAWRTLTSLQPDYSKCHDTVQGGARGEPRARTRAV